MALYLKPHSSEWFDALLAFDPKQAVFIGQIVASAGRGDVCSFCGDDPAEDFRIVKADLAANAVATIRLCEGCRLTRKMMYGEVYEPL